MLSVENVVLSESSPTPPPFQTQAYIVYYFEEKRMNNLTLQILLNFM